MKKNKSLGRILKTVKETYVDGPGIRYSIYFSGCSHQCEGCHNPQSWRFDQGIEITPEIADIIYHEIKENPLITGITFSGGDPFQSHEGLHYLLNKLNDLNKNTWVYTGYTIEDLINKHDDLITNCLSLIDILVDGPFDNKQRDLKEFKGSKNQRFINPKNYLK